MIVNEIYPFLQNTYRKTTEDQHTDDGVKGKNNKKNREMVTRLIHRKPGFNRFGVKDILIKRKLRGTWVVQWLSVCLWLRL